MDTSAKASGTNNLDVEIPQRLYKLRNSLGMSAAEMDRRCGFTSGTTGRLERSEQRVYVSHLYRIADATGVCIDFFYSDDAPAPKASLSPQQREGQRLLDVYLSVNDATLRHDISALVESMADEYANIPAKPDND